MRQTLIIPVLILGSLLTVRALAADKPKQEFYELRVYRIESAEHKQVVDNYLEHALVPALHRLELDRVGVFTRQDDEKDHSLFVLIPYPKLGKFASLNKRLSKDAEYQDKAKALFDVDSKKPAYQRIESRLMKAFAGMPAMELPDQTKNKSARIFEIRIYESHNTDAAARKVEMFNKGEIDIMRDVKMAPVFYGETLIGPDVPNLIYMLSASDRAAHKEHWGGFLKHPEWDRMKKIERYKGTVSKITSWHVAPTSYSDL